MRPICRPFAAAALTLATLAGLILAASPTGARAQDAALLEVTSTGTYEVQTAGVPARVTWDVSVYNNDPSTTPTGPGTVFFYTGLSVPVVQGASALVASDTGGSTLDVSVEDSADSVIHRADIEFGEPLFFGETYAFRLTYDLVDVRAPGVLVNANYAFLPVVGFGKLSTVTVNTPAGEPWVVSLEGDECAGDGPTFTCEGSDSYYLAALVEASQPSATTTANFEVPLADGNLTIALSYFRGEEAVAQHHQELMTAALPVIEQVYGFDYSGPPAVDISQGGRQSIFGYEGLTGCEDDRCEIVISPIADDYTVLHELAHLWSDIYDERWLSEGFAQLLALEVAPQLPEGLVRGPAPQRSPSTIDLALDDWEQLGSAINASDEERDRIAAGYDYSLRFIEELRFRFGMDTLRAVNRNIAGSGTPADSRRFMNVLEGATGENLDDLFLVWVFPGSYREILADRRDAKDRLDTLRGQLADEGLPGDALLSIEQSVADWDIAAARTALDELEDNLGTYIELDGLLATLAADAEAAGLALPSDIEDALLRFDFVAARNLLDSAGLAVIAYERADEKVGASRGIWEKFGLLGRDPDGELNAAKEAFESGDFSFSRERSDSASDTVDDASSVALRRVLIVAGIFAILAVAIGVAFAVGQLRGRAAAEL